ncbi:isochorismatase family protein [Streptomyces sp. NPDC017254]|uniref:isochorismatase family protein n=1 Tax=unclassified Streptomyces TaxID=2593676 RepID=UPI00379D72B0
MPVTTVDPTPALVVIDLQKGMWERDTAHPLGEVVERSVALAEAFRRYGLPVVLVNVTGGAPGRTDESAAAADEGEEEPSAGWSDLMPELGARPDDLRVTKRRWGAFHATDLHERLAALGVTQLVLVGISTSIGVETTARAAFEHGYHVVLATDAMTDTVAEAHRDSVERIFPRLGETATTAEILALLEQSRR